MGWFISGISSTSYSQALVLASAQQSSFDPAEVKLKPFTLSGPRRWDNTPLGRMREINARMGPPPTNDLETPHDEEIQQLYQSFIAELLNGVGTVELSTRILRAVQAVGLIKLICSGTFAVDFDSPLDQQTYLQEGSVISMNKILRYFNLSSNYGPGILDEDKGKEPDWNGVKVHTVLASHLSDVEQRVNLCLEVGIKIFENDASGYRSTLFYTTFPLRYDNLPVMEAFLGELFPSQNYRPDLYHRDVTHHWRTWLGEYVTRELSEAIDGKSRSPAPKKPAAKQKKNLTIHDVVQIEALPDGPGRIVLLTQKVGSLPAGLQSKPWPPNVKEIKLLNNRIVAIGHDGIHYSLRTDGSWTRLSKRFGKLEMD